VCQDLHRTFPCLPRPAKVNPYLPKTCLDECRPDATSRGPAWVYQDLPGCARTCTDLHGPAHVRLDLRRTFPGMAELTSAHPMCAQTCPGKPMLA